MEINREGEPKSVWQITRPIRNRAGWAAAASVVGVAMALIPYAPVSADTPTPTMSPTKTPTRTPTAIPPTPTRTPTPYALGTEIAYAKATETMAARQYLDEQTLKNSRATQTAVANLRSGTPVPASTPFPQSTVGNQVIEAVETVTQKRLDEKATATAKADLTAAAQTALTPAATPARPGNGGRGGGEIPWGGLAILGGGLLGTGWYLRNADRRQRALDALRAGYGWSRDRAAALWRRAGSAP